MLFFPSIITCGRCPDGSKRCKLAQRLYAAHAGAPTCSEPILGAPRPQGPFSERHTTGAHHVLRRGPQKAAEGESEAPGSWRTLWFPKLFKPRAVCELIMRSIIQVIFDGEEAVDAGGVTKEFFLLLLKELMDPVYGMFTHYKESNLLWFSDKVSWPASWSVSILILIFLSQLFKFRCYISSKFKVWKHRYKYKIMCIEIM